MDIHNELIYKHIIEDGSMGINCHINGNIELFSLSSYPGVEEPIPTHKVKYSDIRQAVDSAERYFSKKFDLLYPYTENIQNINNLLKLKDNPQLNIVSSNFQYDRLFLQTKFGDFIIYFKPFPDSVDGDSFTNVCIISSGPVKPGIYKLLSVRDIYYDLLLRQKTNLNESVTRLGKELCELEKSQKDIVAAINKDNPY
jgi:hypothetical protein